MFNRVFITVGTTSFQELIHLVLSDEALAFFVKWGVKAVKIQGGKHITSSERTWVQEGIMFEMYDYKTSIVDDMSWADIIISHAGAGTTIEALDLNKVLLVVPNEKLMDNHQLELANKLDEENYAFTATIDTFFQRAAKVDPSKIKPFPRAQPELVADFIRDHVLTKSDPDPSERPFCTIL